MKTTGDGASCRPARYLPRIADVARPAAGPWRIGVLPGEGSSPEVVRVALEVLDAVAATTATRQ